MYWSYTTKRATKMFRIFWKLYCQFAVVAEDSTSSVLREL